MGNILNSPTPPPTITSLTPNFSPTNRKGEFEETKSFISFPGVPNGISVLSDTVCVLRGASIYLPNLNLPNFQDNLRETKLYFDGKEIKEENFSYIDGLYLDINGRLFTQNGIILSPDIISNVLSDNLNIGYTVDFRLGDTGTVGPLEAGGIVFAVPEEKSTQSNIVRQKLVSLKTFIKDNPIPIESNIETFLYRGPQSPPVLNELLPANGPLKGGFIGLHGSNFKSTDPIGIFSGVNKVEFISGPIDSRIITELPSSSVMVQSDSLINVNIPQFINGSNLKNNFIRIRNDRGTTMGLPFNYLEIPIIEIKSPPRGSRPPGGYLLTLSGNEFSDKVNTVQNIVQIEDEFITGFPSEDSKELNFLAPSAAEVLSIPNIFFELSTSLVVETRGGISNSVNFKYDQTPAISEANQFYIVNDTATEITFTGVGYLETNMTIKFSQTESEFEEIVTNYEFINDNTIRCFTPVSNITGTVDVTIINNLVEGNTIKINYQTTPTLASIDPDNGDSTGGTPVTLAGTNFTSPSTVIFMKNDNTPYPATGIIITSSTEITCLTPNGVSDGMVNETVTVFVETTGGTTSEIVNFTYSTSG